MMGCMVMSGSPCHHITGVGRSVFGAVVVMVVESSDISSAVIILAGQ